MTVAGILIVVILGVLLLCHSLLLVLLAIILFLVLDVGADRLQLTSAMGILTFIFLSICFLPALTFRFHPLNYRFGLSLVLLGIILDVGANRGRLKSAAVVFIVVILGVCIP